MLSPAALRTAAQDLRSTLIADLAAEGDTLACDILHGHAATLDRAADIIDAQSLGDLGDLLNI